MSTAVQACSRNSAPSSCYRTAASISIPPQVAVDGQGRLPLEGSGAASSHARRLCSHALPPGAGCGCGRAHLFVDTTACSGLIRQCSLQDCSRLLGASPARQHTFEAARSTTNRESAEL